MPSRQSMSRNSFCHLFLRNWMFPPGKSNDKQVLKLFVSWRWILGRERQWRRCHLKQLFGNHSDRSTFKNFCCTALPCAFIISDQHIFIASTLVWHCHVPCQSLNCLEHDTKAHMEVVKISLAICQELHHRTFIHTAFVGSHVKSSGRPACW